ncbi:MAG: hypothetical protein B6229_09225 [Spirochaetaceae bacterium 4572_7]|nr:MAG: hypothetical protein B6229_09225 [Spirochaetaceae bacterium 4572_7]
MAKTSFVLSILIHIVILLLLLSITFNPPLPIEKSPIQITMIRHVNELSEHRKNIDNSSVDIVESSVVRHDGGIEISEKGSYIADIISVEPDLIINSSQLEKITDSMSIGGFEESLLDLMGDIELFDDITEESNYDIKWDGEEREAVVNTYIDFSLFPKTTFTGVGLNVNFMVNLNGEVFDVKIVPPGSGSVEFDILIIQQVSKFKFKASNLTSKGEVYIVYQK